MSWGARVCLIATALAAGEARAQPTEPPPPPVEVAVEEREAEPLGPLILIEAIELVGNRSTLDDVILRALPVREGDALRAGDPRLRDARFKLLALGYFRDVNLALRKGTARGHVILTVTVVERGTVVLDRLWFGFSDISPGWAGLLASERNFLGTGLALGGGFVYAANHVDLLGSRDQWAGSVRIADPTVGTTPYGIRGAFTWVHGSEPYRVDGAPGEDSPSNFRAFSYQRAIARAGVTWDVTALTQLGADLRYEAIDAAVPLAPTRDLPGGQVVPVDLHLDPGSSEVVSFSLALDRDTRSDPVLPRRGSRFSAQAELGSTLLGGSYDFASIEANYERWWAFGARGAIGVRLAGGVVLGDAPRFKRIHLSEVNRLMTPRALGLVLAAESPPDLLQNGVDDLDYGELGGTAMIEYRRSMFRRAGRVYGGDAFVAAGLWGLADREDLVLRDASAWNSLPIDVVVDTGIRIDTEIGVFELSFANLLGRVPL